MDINPVCKQQQVLAVKVWKTHLVCTFFRPYQLNRFRLSTSLTRMVPSGGAEWYTTC